MCRQQHDGDVPALLNLLQLLKHVHVYVDFLVDVLEDLVQSPSHEPHHR